MVVVTSVRRRGHGVRKKNLHYYIIRVMKQCGQRGYLFRRKMVMNLQH